MKLADLLERLSSFAESHSFHVECAENKTDTQIELEGMSSESQFIKQNFIFALMIEDVSRKEEVEKYLNEAIEKGATVIICNDAIRKLWPDLKSVTWIYYKNARLLLAKVASKFYGPQPHNCIAVTGTNGKSSTVSFVRQIWEGCGLKAASIGTLGVETSYPEQMALMGRALTTPGPIELHMCLRDLKRQGIENIAMEASSHGIRQYRLDGVKIKVAAFTNLSPEHLDYHKDMEDYYQTKKQLFTRLLNGDGVAVINADIPEYDDLVDTCVMRSHKIHSYGYNGAFVKLLTSAALPNGQRLHFKYAEREFKVQLPLVGDFQASNVACALAIVLSLGADINLVVRALENIKPVPGRMELAGMHLKGAHIYVDYAHTPDALETILKSLRPHTEGKIKLVFGCGGNRDMEKRPVMGRIAQQFADEVIVTDDNPRNEDPAVIRAEVLSECPKAEEIPNRRDAIQQAISSLDALDVLIIAGKGHEKVQIVGDTQEPFDDVRAVREILSVMEMGAR